MKLISFMMINILLFFNCFMPATASAGVKEDYEEAYKIYLAAGACLAVYSHRNGILAYDYLQQDGWEVKPFVQTSVKADARFLLAINEPADSQPMYILAIVGTENLKDVKTDLRVDQVYFAGETWEEFEQNARRSDISGTEPKVHRGFHQFVQAALTAEAPAETGGPKQRLSDLMLVDKQRKVYLVGHSLGGAAATLGGARLLSMGVRPEQIEVITFGAPAVGNGAFARKFEPELNLTRVVILGDPVTGILQKVVGGYKQFGKEIAWKMPNSTNYGPHNIEAYLDVAIKNYYQKRQRAVQAGIIDMPFRAKPDSTKRRVYVAPVANRLPSGLQAEFWYMQQALWDEYRRSLPGYLIDTDQASGMTWRQKALAEGCELMVVPEISGYILKNELNTYYITLQQAVYDVITGRLIDIAIFSTSTVNLTPLEALIYDSKRMSAASFSPESLKQLFTKDHTWLRKTLRVFEP